MMRKAQDRAGLHGGLGNLGGMKELAGFGATLASNKFVRAAIREEVRGSVQIKRRFQGITALLLTVIDHLLSMCTPFPADVFLVHYLAQPRFELTLYGADFFTLRQALKEHQRLRVRCANTKCQEHVYLLATSSVVTAGSRLTNQHEPQLLSFSIRCHPFASPDPPCYRTRLSIACPRRVERCHRGRPVAWGRWGQDHGNISAEVAGG